MNLAYLDLFNHIELNEHTVNVLVIENKNLFREMIQQFMQASLGLDSKWVLSDKGRIVSLNKVSTIINEPFNIDLNERKLLDGLYNEMVSVAMNEVHYMETNQMRTCILTCINNIIQDIDYPFVESEDVSLPNLFKLSGVHFENYEGGILERLSSYAYLCYRFKKFKLLSFVNLKTYFTDEELIEFYKDMEYKKISIILFENREYSQLANEKTTVIDNDLCVVKC